MNKQIEAQPQLTKLTIGEILVSNLPAVSPKATVVSLNRSTVNLNGSKRLIVNAIIAPKPTDNLREYMRYITDPTLYYLLAGNIFESILGHDSLKDINLDEIEGLKIDMPDLKHLNDKLIVPRLSYEGPADRNSHLYEQLRFSLLPNIRLARAVHEYDQAINDHTLESPIPTFEAWRSGVIDPYQAIEFLQHPPFLDIHDLQRWFTRS